MPKRSPIITLILVLLAQVATAAPPTREQILQLGEKLDPILACFNGSKSAYGFDIDVEAEIEVQVRLARFDRDAWRLSVEHKEYAVDLHRTADRTELFLPRHNVLLVGEGDIEGNDHLGAPGIQGRLVSADSLALTFITMAAYSTGQTAAISLVTIGSLEVEDDDSKVWRSPRLDNASLRFGDDGEMTITAPQGRVVVSPKQPGKLAFPARPDDVNVRKIDRTEMERLLTRGIRRALEVLAPGPKLTSPPRIPKQVDHGELRWEQDQRLVLLSGTPQQIGRAHAQLLAPEMRRLGDSVLYAVGIVNTVRTGRWFLDDLRDAWKRLEPHIPDDHKQEMAAMASASSFSVEEAQLANVFPELFHCSGFAVFGDATVDGKLYHGRVLDYMTRIGLQDSAGLFVIAVDGKIPFATVGYAGFIGSVTGMNAKQVSLGEMGGRGEGNWDGVPMATLMRRAMEECSTLDEVKALWRNSPRTCEYYYVFADGKTPGPTAVGVAATPESIEFIEPGQTHPRLGEGFKDVVVMSGGSRLETLRQRVQSHYGEFDTAKAIHLMSRPVAMSSNLHNALFVPQDLVVHVAHASHRKPAADRHYVTYDVGALFDSLGQ